jgi:general secretion pathway protein L
MTAGGKEKLIVHATGPEWAWRVVDRAGRVLERGQCPPEQPDWPAGRPLTVLIDATACIGLKVDLPEMSAARLHKALRWAAEEHLAGSAEDQHVVAGPRDPDGRLCCVVIDHSVMSGLHERFSGMALEVMTPDALCLPWQSGRVDLTAADERILARWGEWDFGSFEADLVEDMLFSVLNEQERCVWHGEEFPGHMDSERFEKVSVGGIDALLNRAMQPPVNLLTGSWAPSSAHTARAHWRWAGGLAAAVLVLGLGFMAIENHQLKRQSAQLQTDIDQRFADIFPGISPVGRHQALAERELTRLRFGESAGLLDLLNRAAPVIDGQSGLVLDGLQYRAGELELSVRAPQGADLEQFEQRLRALDLNAEVRSISMQDDEASGRVRIVGGGQ